MKAKVSLFHPVVQPDGSVIRRKPVGSFEPRHEYLDLVDFDHFWIEYYETHPFPDTPYFDPNLKCYECYE